MSGTYVETSSRSRAKTALVEDGPARPPHELVPKMVGMIKYTDGDVLFFNPLVKDSIILNGVKVLTRCSSMPY